MPKAKPVSWATRARLMPLGLALAVAPFSGQPARAALVVLSGGEVVKAFGYEVVGENARLTFETGGAITMPLERVERVLDDEVEPVVPDEPAPAPVEAAFASRFDPQHPIPADPYGAVIYEAAKKHALNPALVAAVVRTESAGRVKAVSSKGACGLMQIMPATGKRFGLRRADLFDAGKNLDAGSRYLAWLLDRYDGDLSKSLAAYNAGEGTVDRYGGVPPYRETRGYVRRIFSLLGLVTVASGSMTPAAATATAAVVAGLSR